MKVEKSKSKLEEPQDEVRQRRFKRKFRNMNDENKNILEKKVIDVYFSELSKNDRILLIKFLSPYFSDIQPKKIFPKRETDIIKWCEKYINDRFNQMKYILGLPIDFTLLAQELSKIDCNAKKYRKLSDINELFSIYTLVKMKGKRKANTLTLKYGGSEFGIRKIEEKVVDLFHKLRRSNYPSAYVYNTGQWQKYQDLLLQCFRLSEQGRLQLIIKLITLGLAKLPINRFYSRDIPRIRLFEKIITDYPRGVAGENGGLIFQAISFGYFSADRPYLNIVTDKVRTGSSRQKRFGDIDCYYGLDLEISVEVKDFKISSDNFDKELGEFQRNVLGNKITGIAFIHSIDKNERNILINNGVKVLTKNDVLFVVSTWDWPKQDKAVQSTLHYISHIEQDTIAVKRLLKFIKETDKNHDSLAFFDEQENVNIEL